MNRLMAIVRHVCSVQGRAIGAMWSEFQSPDVPDSLVVQFDDRWLELDGALMFLDSKHVEELVMYEVAALFKPRNLGKRERR